MVEIERRFLCRVADTGALEREGRRIAIRQGYLTRDDPTVRVRQKDGEYLLTVKSGSGRVRQEVEVAIGPAEGEALMAMAGEHRLEKVRYAVGRWEVDVFGEKLVGLVLAEVELEREDEALPAPPPWLELVREVTDDAAFTNQRLAWLGPAEAARFVRGAGALGGGRRASGEQGCRMQP